MEITHASELQLKALCQRDFTFLSLHVIYGNFVALYSKDTSLINEDFSILFFCIPVFKSAASYLKLCFFEKINLNISFCAGSSEL